MEITIGSWFTEPGVYFKFSYKVELFFREQVIDYIIVPNKLDKINEDKYLHLTICTKLNQDIQDILDVNRGPKWRKNTTNRNHAIWIP